jgi:hypothetical protein
MNAHRKFADEILEGLSKSKVLRIRAGAGQHRFIGIWVVVVEDRVFVRSWGVKADGWYSTFLKEANGAIQVAGEALPVRAVPIKDKRLRDATDRAYLKKYSGKGSLKYAKDLGSAKSRATTLELVPVPKTRS